MSLIRTTYHGRLSALRLHNQRLADRLGRAQEEASTGLKVTRPSDDAGRVSRLHKLRAQAEDQQVYAEAAEWAFGLQARADEALGGIADALSDARELAVQLSSETPYTDDDRVRAVATAQGMLEDVLLYANAQFGERYVFAGNAYDSPAYDASGTYQGDNGEPEIPVADGLEVSAGWDGSSLLQGTEDIVGVFTSLITALGGGSHTDVRATLDQIDGAIDQLAEARTIVGAEMRVAEDALDLTISLESELSGQIATITDADPVESYTRLYEMQAAFEASLQVTANARTGLLFSRI